MYTKKDEAQPEWNILKSNQAKGLLFTLFFLYWLSHKPAEALQA